MDRGEEEKTKRNNCTKTKEKDLSRGYDAICGNFFEFPISKVCDFLSEYQNWVEWQNWFGAEEIHSSCRGNPF